MSEVMWSEDIAIGWWIEGIALCPFELYVSSPSKLHVFEWNVPSEYDVHVTDHA